MIGLLMCPAHRRKPGIKEWRLGHRGRRGQLGSCGIPPGVVPFIAYVSYGARRSFGRRPCWLAANGPSAAGIAAGALWRGFPIFRLAPACGWLVAPAVPRYKRVARNAGAMPMLPAVADAARRRTTRAPGQLRQQGGGFHWARRRQARTATVQTRRRQGHCRIQLKSERHRRLRPLQQEHAQ